MSLFEQEAGPQPPKEITTAFEINALLKSLQQTRTPLAVTFEGRSEVFQSFIVELDAEILLIDELIPSIGDRLASRGDRFRVDAWLDGVHVRWDCDGAQQQVFENTPAFSLPLPRRMSYHQRRGAFRAFIPFRVETGIRLVHRQHERLFQGRLLDISATGCKALLAGDLSQSLQPGEVYECSQMVLPEDIQLDIAMEIRHAELQPDMHETHVGLRFQQPGPLAQRQIDRFVHFLQREARRLEKDDLF